MPDLSIDELLKSGDWERAKAVCQAALQVQPTSAKLHAYLGLSLFRMGEYDLAIASFERATILAPDFVDAGVKLAQCYDKTHRYEDAYRVASEWLVIRPGHPVLTAIATALESQVKGNRTDSWEVTRRIETHIVYRDD